MSLNNHKSDNDANNIRPESSQLSHKQLLMNAKQTQKSNLIESHENSKRLTKTIQAVIKGNSNNVTDQCPAVLDKITTIHQLDQEINRQLKEDVAVNFENLMNAKNKLKKVIYKTNNKIYGDANRKHGTIEQAEEPNKSFNNVDFLQRRVELIDQDLRILENSLKLIKLNR